MTDVALLFVAGCTLCFALGALFAVFMADRPYLG